MATMLRRLSERGMGYNESCRKYTYDMFRGTFCSLKVPARATSNDRRYTRIEENWLAMVPCNTSDTMLIIPFINFVRFAHTIPELCRDSRGKFAGETRWPTIDRTGVTVGTRHQARVITSAVL
jgi:hypothetical protein